MAFVDNEERFLTALSYINILTGLSVVWILSRTQLNAAYGRYSSGSWGFPVNPKLAWMLQECPTLLVPLYLLIYTQCDQLWRPANTVLLAAFLVHYVQRTLIFPLLIRGGKSTPVTVFLIAFGYCLCNGYLQCRSLTQYTHFPSLWVWQPRFIIGIVLFVCGMAINLHSDHILRNLRKPGETGYKIPTGGMFEYVSGANFLGEILEWTGYALACWSLHAFAFAFFTLCNIGPRACAHHRWYLEKFKDTYPKDRKALIPFLL